MSNESIYIKIQQQGGEVVAKSIRDIGVEAQTTDKRTALLTKQNAKTTQSNKALSSSSDKVANSFNQTAGVSGLLKTAISGIGVGLVAHKLVGMADTLQTLQNKLKVVTDGTAELAQVQGKLFEVALRSRTGIGDVADLYSRMARSTKALGLSQQDTINLTETISQALQVSGASAQETGSAVLQLGQALASGVLRGEEFNAISEASPILMAELAKSLGITKGELRAYAQEGKLTADLVIKAFQQQSGSIEDQFSKMDITVGQAFTNMRTNLLQSFASFDKASGFSHTLAQAIEFIGNNIGNLIKTVAVLGVALTTNYIGSILQATNATSGFKNVASKLFLLIRNNPIFLIVTALGGLYSLLSQNSEGVEAFKKTWSKLFSLVSDGITGLINSVISIGQTLGLLPDSISKVKGSFSSFIEFINKGMTAIPFMFYSAFKYIQSRGQNFISDIIFSFQQFPLYVSKIAQEISLFFAESFQSIIDGYNNTIGAISDSIKIDIDVTTGLKNSLKDIDAQISGNLDNLNKLKQARITDADNAVMKFVIDTMPIEKANEVVREIKDKDVKINVSVQQDLVNKQFGDLMAGIEKRAELAKAKISGDMSKVFALSNNVDTSKFTADQNKAFKAALENATELENKLKQVKGVVIGNDDTDFLKSLGLEDNKVSSIFAKLDLLKNKQSELTASTYKLSEAQLKLDLLGSIGITDAQGLLTSTEQLALQTAELERLKDVADRTGIPLAELQSQLQTQKTTLQETTEAQNTFASAWANFNVDAVGAIAMGNLLSSSIMSIGDNMSSTISDVLSGSKSFADGFKEMTVNILQDIANLIIKMLVFKALMASLQGLGLGGGSGLGSLFGFSQGGEVGVGGSPIQAFSDGGAVFGAGTATSDSVPAMLSNGEYVIKASSVNALGTGFLDKLNTTARIPKYATGGYVGTQPSTPSNSSMPTTTNTTNTSQSSNQNIKIVVVMNKDELANEIANSAGMETRIINVARANNAEING